MTSSPVRSSLTGNLLLRHVRARPRLFVGAVFGALVGVLLPEAWVAHPVARALVAWNAGALLYLVMAAIMMVRASSHRTQVQSRHQDVQPWLVLMMVVLAALASLVAIVMELGVAKDLHGWNRSAHIALACLTIVTSWAFTHVMFALHYAHEYYRVLGEGDPAPLDFPGGTAPTYVDFLYMSMVIGTSGQTADVALASSGMRRIGLLHCTLAFAFNTTVLALMINIAAGLI